MGAEEREWAGTRGVCVCVCVCALGDEGRKQHYTHKRIQGLNSKFLVVSKSEPRQVLSILASPLPTLPRLVLLFP